MSKAVHLKNTLPAICNAITGEKGIKLVWNGPPRTDGKTIYTNPLPAQADEDTVTMVTGDIDHECAHILFTDFEELNKRRPDALTHGVWNGLEDTMVERRLAERYLGCRQTLAESAEIAVRQGKVRTGAGGPSDALITFVDAWGRYHVNGQVVDTILASSKAALVDFLGERGVQRLEALLATKLYSAASTAETYNVAGQVLQLIKDIEQEQQEPPEHSPDDENQDGDDEGEERGGSSEPGGAGDGADADGQDDRHDGQQGNNHGDDQGGQPEDGDDVAQPDTNPKGQGDQKNDDGDSQDAQRGRDVEDVSGGNGAGGTPQGATAILQDDDVDTGPVVDLKATVEEAIEALEKTDGFVPGVSGYSPPTKEVNSDRYATLKAHIGGEIAQLQRRLAAMFETRRRCRSIISDEGRLDSRRLHLAIAGSRAVYRRKEVKVVPKPAVSFALDCSGSMNGLAMDLALQAVIAVVEVCDRMTMPTEIVVFGMTVGIVKGFEEPLSRSRAVLGGIEAHGGTPAAEGLWEAANHLVQRREDRKILFVVTDGGPNSPQATKEVGEMIEASGIELYGIGIGSDAIRNYCSKAEVLTDANGIAAAVLTALEARMF